TRGRKPSAMRRQRADAAISSVSWWLGCLNVDGVPGGMAPGTPEGSAWNQSSNSLKVQRLPPAGTLATLGSPIFKAYTPPIPLVTVTYCLPSFSQVMGCPTMPDGVWNCQTI